MLRQNALHRVILAQPTRHSMNSLLRTPVSKTNFIASLNVGVVATLSMTVKNFLTSEGLKALCRGANVAIELAFTVSAGFDTVNPGSLA